MKENRFSPFGMVMPGRKYVAGNQYRYGFNGKENDNEVKGDGNQQDYGFRVYDPRIAKFLSVDPITNEYPWYTPYQFTGNSPLATVDIDGLEPNKVFNWVEKFIKGGIKQIIGHKDGVPAAQQPYTLDIFRTHTGQSIPFGTKEGLDKLDKYIKNPGTIGIEAWEKSKQSASQLYEDIKSGDPEKIGRVFTAALTFGIEAYSAFRVFSKSFGVTRLKNVTAETIYRVQGGGSKLRFVIEGNNKLAIAGDDMLFINIGQEDRAVEFLAKRGDNAVIFKFEINKTFADKIRKDAVPQRLGRQNPGKPQVVDATKAPDQYGIPKEYFDDLLKNIKENSVEIIQKKSP